MLALFLRRALIALACLAAAAPCAAQRGLAPGANEYGRFEPIPAEQYEALSDPEFVDDPRLAGLRSTDPVLGLEIDGDARCYPLRLMTYHHVVNDRVGGQRVSVTYCGIAKTSVCFLLEEDSPGLRAGGMYGGMLAVCEREAPDAPSDAAATDASESSGASEAAPPGEVRDDAAAGFAEGVAERRLAAWAQIAPVSAPGAVEAPAPRLGPPLATTSLARWRRLHPNTKILKPVDSHAGHYEAADRKLRGESPHANPSHNQTVTRVDPRLDPEAEVFGVAIGGESAAWTLDELKRAGTVEATLSGRRVVARWDAALNDPVVETVDATLGGGDGAGVQDESETFALRSLWYAWGNFHPETKLSERALAEAGAVSRDAPREASE